MWAEQLQNIALYMGLTLEQCAADGGSVGDSNRRREELEAWQGQGLDEVLRPVPPLPSVQAGEACKQTTSSA